MSKLLWLPVNAAQAIYTLLWSAGWILAALGVRVVTRSSRLPLAMARRVWAPGLLAGAGARLRASGLEHVDPAGTYFFVSNHQSMIDIPVLFRLLPVDLHFIVKDELRGVPFLGWYISAMGMIFVRRGSGRLALAQVRAAARLIADGRSVLAFPEGTRGKGTVQPFKTGVFLPALEAGVPIVPIAITGASRVLPARGFAVRPGLIQVAIGEPIPAAELANLDRHQTAARVREAVAELYASLD
jgi:1-acyl-sn-glycerol-3-phosphate acyltransferase